MSHISEAPIGGKFRAVAHADLDTEVGTFGDTDLLCVQVGAAGTLEAASATVVHGVIWTREGRAEESTTPDAVIGGRTYTVITRGQFAEMEVGASPFSAGDDLYAQAAGAVDAFAGGVAAGAGAKYIGKMVTDNILVVDVGLLIDGQAP